MENEYIYVGYILGDYARPLWMSKKQAKVRKEIDNYKARGGKRPTWIERYILKSDNLIKLDDE